MYFAHIFFALHRYRCLFPAMISNWRAAFAMPDLPFLYVLLAGGHTAVMREAQYLGAGALHNTGFASAMDLGAFGSEYLIPGHPPRKQEVGRRLSLLLRSFVFNSSLTHGPRVDADQVIVKQSVTGSSSKHSTTATATTTTVATIPFLLGDADAGTLHANITGSCATKNLTDAANIAARCASVNGTSSWVVSFADPNGAHPNSAFQATEVRCDACRKWCSAICCVCDKRISIECAIIKYVHVPRITCTCK